MGFYFVPVAFACGLGIGFLLGLWAYSHVYGHFLVREEEKANRKAIRAVNDANKKRVDSELVVKRLRDMFGNDLSAGHQQVMTEEIERVLGTGPHGGNNGA